MSYLDLAQRLISVPSTSGNKDGIDKVLNIVRQEVSTPCREFPGSLLFFNKKTDHFRIILNAHLDVVPGKDEQFSPSVKDKRLYGRGAIDMKGAAAAMITLFEEIADSIDYPLALQIVTDEETGGHNGTKHHLEQGITADFVIAGEPTDLAINTQSKGILRATLRTRGKTAHGAYPWQGKNAIIAMTYALGKLLNTYPIPQKEEWKTTINIARISTDNDALNKVPDTCTAELDIRYLKGQADEIIQFLSGLADVDITMREPEHHVDDEHPDVVHLKKAIEITGKKARTVVKHGGSDIRFYTAKGIPGVTFGPIGSGLHTDDEWVDIESLDTYYKILEHFLKSM